MIFRGISRTPFAAWQCAKGDRVAVLARSDPNGNTDWWRVRKADGSEGFVAAAFLEEA